MVASKRGQRHTGQGGTHRGLEFQVIFISHIKKYFDMFVNHSEDDLVYVKYLCVDSFFSTRIKILHSIPSTCI